MYTLAIGMLFCYRPIRVADDVCFRIKTQKFTTMQAVDFVLKYVATVYETCYIFPQQTQAPANRNARSKQWQP